MLGITRQEAARRALRHARIAVEACDSSELDAYRAISLANRAHAELVNGLLDEAVESIRLAREALAIPLTGMPIHPIVNDQAARKLPLLEGELERVRNVRRR